MSTGPHPPEPDKVVPLAARSHAEATDTDRAIRVKKRGGILRRAAINARTRRIMDLRAMNVPLTQIAREVGLAPERVRALVYAQYSREQSSAPRSLLDKYERTIQLELLDSRLTRAIMGADPLALMGVIAPGPNAPQLTISFRDWLGAVEGSRRVKCDLIRLHGLEGVSSVADPDASRADPGDPAAAGRIIRAFVAGIREHDPATYDRLVAYLDAAARAAGALPEEDLPLTGGTRGREDDGPEDEGADL